MRGFSLIEAIIYIALLGFLMAGAIVSAYQITQNSYLLSGKNTVQEEGSFVLRKIDWAMSGAHDLPTVSGSSVEIDRHTGPNVTFAWAGDEVTLNGVPLTTENVQVSAFDITYIPPIGTGPEGFTLKFTLDGVDFVTTKYVR